MQETLNDPHSSISIVGIPISNQHDQQQCRYQHERQEARKSDQLQVIWRKPVQGWYHYGLGPNKNCHGDSIYYQTGQVVDKQFHKLQAF
ncbi:hypothetical protein DPMN_105179 [Dreissena polymorpha]|uniref:Uncharacterized protein n=1 Tax=Dreissena polymorpha TaxID=45954 RepID=A0A9D4K308_DREPO|nr:hypothetical protein DPMN_105179 [Dreissena polymorpha]